jgi:hypothetical protein
VRSHQFEEALMRRDDEDELEEDVEDEDEEQEDAEDEEAGGSGRLGGFAIGLTLGVLVGAGVALLLAPASGNVTRRRLRRKLDHARELASDGIDELRKRARRELRRRTESAEKA